MNTNEVQSNKTYTTLFGDHFNNLIVFGNPDVFTEFQNHMKMEFWGENYISFHNEDVKGIPILIGDKLSFETPEKTYYWEPKIPNQMRWVEVLKVKPTSNKWSLKIADEGKFNYKYQTPLAEIAKRIPESRIEYVTEDGIPQIHLIYPTGHPLTLDGRPLEIDGSIAVYHKTKKDNIVGQKNYRTGKVLHIPRPKAVDKNGNWIWCDIQVKDGVYTRTTPQLFLDNAVYPVIINDVFGTNTFGASFTTCSTGYQYAVPKGTPAASGNATSIHFYSRFVNGTIVATAGFWNDNGGVPGTLVDDAGEVTNTGGADTTQWWDSNLDDSPVAINSANSYWLGLDSDVGAGLHRWYYDDSTEDLYQEVLGYVSGTLANFGTPVDTIANREQSIYITYTPSVAGMAGAMTTNTGYWGW